MLWEFVEIDDLDGAVGLRGLVERLVHGGGGAKAYGKTELVVGCVVRIELPFVLDCTDESFGRHYAGAGGAKESSTTTGRRIQMTE
jgi:hypothetical protein